LDSISTGATIAFAMECFEKKILKLEDTDGLEIKFGNKNALPKIVEQIAFRKGIGKVLAKGVKEASRVFGKGAHKYALNVRGKEIPMHEPRGKPSLALAYALSSIGADHLQAAHDPSYASDSQGLFPLGILHPIDRMSLGPEKVRAFTYLQMLWSAYDCLDICKFVFKPSIYGIFEIEDIPNLIDAVAAWNTTLWEIMKVGERAITLERLYNLREGIKNFHDNIPSRFFQGLGPGPREGAHINKKDFSAAISMYYEFMGWDALGVPLKSKLLELGCGCFTKTLDFVNSGRTDSQDISLEEMGK
jgi:aldehyde:ferredoxin oxidoreductase